MSEQVSVGKHYKIRLASGRVLGPFDLERIRLFISKNKISGNEVARLYPTGQWKDINQFPEIAELILLHLEGKLGDKSSTKKEREQEPPSDLIDVPVIKSSQRSVRTLDNQDAKGTVIMTQDEEGTMVVTEEEQAAEEMEVSQVEPAVAHEKTVMLARPPLNQENLKKKKNLLTPKVATAIAVLALIIVAVEMFQPAPQKEVEENTPFVVEVPKLNKNKVDIQKSELSYKSGITFFNYDTVDGYKRASKFFSKAIVQDPNNVKALSMLAVSYINLVEVVSRDEKFFQVIMGLIEAARAKNVDLSETVIADVELYNLLANQDAAIQRIVEYTKILLKQKQTLGIELFYYLALSFYLKDSYGEAVKYLDNISPQQWFSPRIPFLYGRIFSANNQLDQAVVAFEKVLEKSPSHIKARIHLAEVLLRKADFMGAAKHADYVINHPQHASDKESARAYYIRARMLASVNRNAEALSDLEKVRKALPDDIDVLFEYYTIKARMGVTSNETKKQIKMYEYLAKGEHALKRNNLEDAMTYFMGARNSVYDHSQPLLRIAEVFRRQGDLYSAMKNYDKAMKLAQGRADLYPGYIHALIDSFEFEAAKKAIEKFSNLNPPPAASTLDTLMGLLYMKQEKYRESLAYFKRALQTSVIDSRVYNYYADILFRGGNFRDAAFYYGLAKRFDPLDAASSIGMAKSLIELESLERGVSFMQSELQRSAKKAPLFVGLAEVYMRKNEFISAQKAIDQALSDDPKFAPSYKVRGDVFQAQEQYKQALDAYQTYLSLNPSDPTPRIERYKIAMKKLEFAAARAEITHVIKNYPSYPGAHYMLGELALQAQNPDEAFREADLEIRLNPSYLLAYVLAGSALNVRKEHVKALEYLNQVLKSDANNISALIGAGYSNHMLKSYAAAQTLLERALKVDSGNPLVRKRLGSLYFDMGNKELATQHLKAYLDLLPDASDKSEIQRMIQ